jgi:putative PEP-CTERM system histidine kinase
MSPPVYLSWISYGLGALAYASLALQLGFRGSRSTAGKFLLAACVASAAWEIAGFVQVYAASDLSWTLYQLADIFRWALWMAFLAFLVRGRRQDSRPASARTRLLASAIIAASLIILLMSLRSPAGTVHAFGLWVIASIAGLVLCEHIFRSTPPEGRWAMKPLCIAVAALFGFDLFFFSDAAMMRGIDADFWSARGIAHALPIPLLLVASARNRAWSIDVAVSRAIVFRSTALLISGIYLLAVAATGYYVRLFGGNWGKAIQTVFLAAALIVLVVLFSSGTFRSRLKVYISKNFFSYRYDYREEWLRFTSRLSESGTLSSVYERAIGALADLVESPGGTIWLRHEDGAFRPGGSWNMASPKGEEGRDSAFVSFLARTGWVIDLQRSSVQADNETLPPVPAWLRSVPDAWLVIPMSTEDGLLGFTLLLEPRTTIEVNWEVLDLLKTAAKQAASYLGHVRAIEALLEARQFDAFNKMSAFVVHDLKNLIAQLSLLLRNAERHAANPEFQSDMLETVRHVVERMSRLLLQLRSGEAPVELARPVELSPIIERVRSSHGGRGCTLDIEVQRGLRALGHEERLERVIGHLVQNAIDASEVGAAVRISAHLREDGCAAIEVADRGKGMSAEFVRDVLFKPFRTTKSTGMGIGAFESQQYVSEIGGHITVHSAPGEGSRFVILLPGSADIARNHGQVTT